MYAHCQFNSNPILDYADAKFGNHLHKVNIPRKPAATPAAEHHDHAKHNSDRSEHVKVEQGQVLVVPLLDQDAPDVEGGEDEQGKVEENDGVVQD